MNGIKIEDFIMEIGKLATNLSMDPLIVLFGLNFYKLQLKKDYRQLA
jgi:hypothetical protein